MAQALKKHKIERDQFTEDGVRLFNRSKEHGVIYCDGFMEAKYIQEYEGESVQYRGDGAPVGYKKGVPMPRKAEELLTENEALQARIRDLEDSQKRTEALLRQLVAQGAKAPEPAPAAAPTTGQINLHEADPLPSGLSKAPEAPARGGKATK
jgi:hypothetical protein